MLAGEALGALLSDVPAGMILGKLGKKRAMALGLGVALFSTTILFWSGSIASVLALRLLAGFGRSLFSVSRHAYIAEATAVESRGRSIALLGGVFRVGRFAGPAVGGSIAAVYGLRAPFLLYGIVCGVAVMILVAFVRRGDGSLAKQSRTLHQQGRHLFATVKDHRRVLTAAGTGQIFAQMIRAGRNIIIPLYGANVIGLDPQAIGMIISIAAGIDMSLFYPTGVIMDRLGRKFAIVPSFFIQAVGMGLVSLTSSYWGLLLAASVIGFGNGLSSGTMMTLGADLAPRNARGEFLGVWRLIGDLGVTGGPLVAGAVAELVLLSTAALALAGSGLIAAGIFALFVSETLPKRAQVKRLS
jgi:MFS family permease